EVSLMMCVEMSLSDGKPIVDVLVEQGFASRNLAQACLAVQQLVDGGTLSKDIGCLALKFVEQKHMAISRAVAAAGLTEVGAKTPTLLQDLFVLSGLVEPKDMPQLTDKNFSSYEEFVTSLTAKGKIADHMVDALARSLYLIEHKLLTPEDAVMAL